MVVPSPSWPWSFFPQVQTVLSLFSATAPYGPAAIAVTPVSPETWTGVSLLRVVPLPSWPLSFLPQAQTVPSLLSATV